MIPFILSFYFSCLSYCRTPHTWLICMLTEQDMKVRASITICLVLVMDVEDTMVTKTDSYYQYRVEKLYIELII